MSRAPKINSSAFVLTFHITFDIKSCEKLYQTTSSWNPLKNKGVTVVFFKVIKTTDLSTAVEYV